MEELLPEVVPRGVRGSEFGSDNVAGGTWISLVRFRVCCTIYGECWMIYFVQAMAVLRPKALTQPPHSSRHRDFPCLLAFSTMFV